ncbi:MAG: formamidopyrimidine-DNA glycosylase [bacterium]|nr:formamidopyrimidine-DNA glycosylase [bacterium]
MPELPDVTVYIDSLERRILGEKFERLLLPTPFVLRSVEPAPAEFENRRVEEIRRLGKRIVIGFEDQLFMVIHLMIAGRFQWRDRDARPGRKGIAVFHFSSGTLTLTEAGRKRHASLHLVRGEEALREHDPGGLEVLECDLADFVRVLHSENHTLKRFLTDPHLLSGIGNAYSDEILHRSRLSPLRLTSQLNDDEIACLYQSTLALLREWIERLRAEVGDDFPAKVTAFRSEMAVHGRYREPCPDCGSPVQRIAYASNETNYCAECQNEGRLLADRALSRLLKDDWPRTVEQLEALRKR